MRSIEAPGLLATGAAVIADYLTRLPNAPGVYRMISADGDVLYVGKAASLKKRVQAYTKPFDQPARIARMIANTASMEFVQTASEVEALLLEANLIKRLKPRYNILMRDDKSFPYILVTGDHAAPQIIKHRGAKARKGYYFGPFASAGAVNRTLNTLQRAFLLRSCSDSAFESRTRPCLLHQIKRCAAPCVGKIAADDYRHLVEQARNFLQGKSDEVRGELSRDMENGGGGARFREGCALARSHSLAGARAAAAGDQSGYDRRGGFVCGTSGRRAYVHSGVLFPLGSELGQSRLFPEARSRRRRRRGAR